MRVNASDEATVPQLMSTVQLLTWNRELLVSQVKSTQCILDNLLKSGFFCQEDVETVQPAVTKADQVRLPGDSRRLRIAQLMLYDAYTRCESVSGYER